MGAFEGERAVVVGAGVAGSAAARVLLAEGATVRVSESAHRRGPVSRSSAPRGSRCSKAATPPATSTARRWSSRARGYRRAPRSSTWARERGIPVWGEMELGARLARAPYLAVTGTNGKTTTTGMLAACLRAAGLDAVACGNIGRPFPTAAREPHDALVVEVSSFQLATQTSFHPRVSVLLNLAQDHLDWHGSFDAYAAAKARVFALQGAGDVHVGNLDDEAAAAISRSAPCEVRWFTVGEPADDGAGFRDGRLTAGWSGADLGALAVDTPAMRADAAAAATAAHAFGVGDDAIAEGIAVVRARTRTGASRSPPSTRFGSSTTRRRRTRTRRSPPSARPTGSS